MSKNNQTKSAISFSLTEKDFIQQHRALPTSNSIQIVVPDKQNTQEKTFSTPNPYPKLLENGLHGNESAKKSLNIFNNINESSHLLQSRDLNKSIGYSPISIKESDAKQLARRFAEDRFKAEKEAESWMKKYQELLSKLQASEASLLAYQEETAKLGTQEKNVDSKILQEFINEIKEWENKGAQLENILLESRKEANFFRKRAEELEKSLKEVSSEMTTWRDKSKAFDTDILKKISIYEKSIAELTENLEKKNHELVTLKEFTQSQATELLQVQDSLLSKDLDLKKERNKGKNNENEANVNHKSDSFFLNMFLFASVLELRDKQLQVWEERCLAIESEWSSKYGELEMYLRQTGAQELKMKRDTSNKQEEIEKLYKEKEVYEQNIRNLEQNISELEGKLRNQCEKLDEIKSSDSNFRFEIERLSLEKEKSDKELANKNIFEASLLLELENYKTRLYKLEKEREEEMNHWTLKQNEMQKSQTSQEIFELKLRNKAEKEELENEIQQLKTKLQMLTFEKESLQNKLINSNEKDIEINEKNRLILAKEAEIEEIKFQNSSLNNQLAQLKNESNNNLYELQSIQKVQREHQEKSKRAFFGNSEDLQTKLASCEEELARIRKENVVLKEEIEFFRILKEKEELEKFSKMEIDAQKIAYETIIGQLKDRVMDLETNLSRIIKDFDEFKGKTILQSRTKDNIAFKNEGKNEDYWIIWKENMVFFIKTF